MCSEDRGAMELQDKMTIGDQNAVNDRFLDSLYPEDANNAVVVVDKPEERVSDKQELIPSKPRKPWCSWSKLCAKPDLWYASILFVGSVIVIVLLILFK